MPKQINTPTPGQALVRQFSLKGRYQPVLDETIVPVTIVPLDAPASKRIAIGGTNAAASGAGNQNISVVRNPPRSGHLIILTKVIAISGTPLSDHVYPSFEAHTSTSGNPGWFRDKRLVGTPVARLFGVAAASAVQIPPQYNADDTINDVEFVIPPGWQLNFRQGSVNDTLDMIYEWYEIALTGGTEL